jgi:hypothetical protein
MMQDPDETSHLINEYRVNAERMRAQAYATRRPELREHFEKLARDYDRLADQEEARVYR